MFNQLKYLSKNYKSFLNNIYKIIIILAVVFDILIFPSYLFHMGLVPIYSDKTNNIISILIQIEAAIIAIIISFSLVAVQLASQTYSARLIEIIKGNKFFLIVIVSYFIIIIYGIILLILLDNSKTFGIKNLLILYEYFFSILIFIAIIPLYISILNSLKPSKMIDRLAEKITEKNLKSSFYAKSNLEENSLIKMDLEIELLNSLTIDNIKPNIKTDEEPIQPIIDIIQSSIINKDFETSKYGLKIISFKVKKILDNIEIKEDKNGILTLILTYLARIGLQSIENEDEDVIGELIISMNMFINIALEEKFNDTIFLSIFSLTQFCRLSIKKELVYSSAISSVSLGKIGIELSNENIEDLTILTSNYITKMGKLAIERELDDTILFTIKSIVTMAQTSPRKFNLINNAINYILEAGAYSTKKHIEIIEDYSTSQLKRMIDKLLNTDDIIFLSNISKYFFDTAMSYLEHELIYKKEIMDKVILRSSYLKQIAVSCIHKGFLKDGIKI